MSVYVISIYVDVDVVVDVDIDTDVDIDVDVDMTGRLPEFICTRPGGVFLCVICLFG